MINILNNEKNSKTGFSPSISPDPRTKMVPNVPDIKDMYLNTPNANRYFYAHHISCLHTTPFFYFFQTKPAKTLFFWSKFCFGGSFRDEGSQKFSISAHSFLVLPTPSLCKIPGLKCEIPSRYRCLNPKTCGTSLGGVPKDN